MPNFFSRALLGLTGAALLWIGTLLQVPVITAEGPAQPTVEVHPTSVRFDTVGERMSLLVTGVSEDGSRRDLSHTAKILAADPTLIRVDDDGSLVPLAPPERVLRPTSEESYRVEETFRLRDDYREETSSFGPWTLWPGETPRKGQYGPDGDFPKAIQPGWRANGAQSVMRALDPAVTGTSYDLPEGSIFCHSPSRVQWTAPRDGRIRFRGSAWLIRNLNRVVTVTLVHKPKKNTRRAVLIQAVPIPDRDVNDDGITDGPSSEAPFQLHEILEHPVFPNPLDTIDIHAGDTITFSANGGDFYGIDLSFSYLESESQRTPVRKTHKTEVIVEAAGQRISVPVEINDMLRPEVISFKNDVEVALSKQNCNMGACHATLTGKGGFQLSLRAYDPESDYESLALQDFGRRTNTQDPERSLLLKKPLMDVAHGGGQRLLKTDPAYEILLKWIEQGCKSDRPGTPDCVRIEVHPETTILKLPESEQQLQVLAHFSDGDVRDVTRMVLYTSSRESVAKVTRDGLIHGLQRGESAITARYLEHMVTVSFALLEEVKEFAWPSPPIQSFIDELVDEKLRLFQIAPSELCSDGEFIRRVHLDLVGTLPSRDRVREFLDDQRPEKRNALIDSLLDQPEFAAFWALKWGDLLRQQNKTLSKTGVQKLHRWLRSSFELNTPYDEFAHALLTATGSTFDNPPANYYRAARDAGDYAETSCQIFMGLKLQCAKCHNHPFERWTQDNYYGIQAFFTRIRKKNGTRKNESVIWNARGGEVIHPRDGSHVKPWLPELGNQEVPNTKDRRKIFTEWLVRKENPYFARVEVNRVWGQLLGRGIVEPTDDFRDSNPPSNAPLLDGLTREFVKNGFDRKHLIREIARSRTYQVSARTNRFNQEDDRYFSHALPRLLSAEQLLDAICQVTGVRENFSGLPEGTLATQLPSPDFKHPFLNVFGRPPRDLPCECERSSNFGLSQALQMINGPVVQAKLTAENNSLRQLVTAGSSPETMVTELYLSAFARLPNEKELSSALKHLNAQKSETTDLTSGLEDVCWALLNTKEFLYQH